MEKSAIFVAMTLALALAGCDGGHSDDGTAAKSKPAAPAIDVTAKDISAAFQANEVKAKNDYGDKTLRVTGTVKAMELDLMDNPVVKLKGANDMQNMGLSTEGKMTDVVVSGLPKDVVGGLTKGKEITVICSDVQEAMGSAMLNGCSVAS